jgi:hypothetical protein
MICVDIIFILFKFYFIKLVDFLLEYFLNFVSQRSNKKTNLIEIALTNIYFSQQIFNK